MLRSRQEDDRASRTIEPGGRSGIEAKTTPSPADFYFETPEGKLSKFPKGHQWDYHIAGQITLSNPIVWTATLNGYGNAQVFNFGTLQSAPFPQTLKKFMRTLCVRQADKTP